MDPQTSKWKGNLSSNEKLLEVLRDGTNNTFAACWILPASSSLKIRKGTTQSPAQPSSSQGAGKSGSSEVGSEEMEVDGQTNMRQYRVWHPDESMAFRAVAGENLFSSLDEMAATYVLPHKRMRGRDDGSGGVCMFQPTEKAPPGVEGAIFGANLTGLEIKCDFPDREKWDSILEGDFRKARLGEKKKRRFNVDTSGCGFEQKSTTSPVEGGIRKSRKDDERPDLRVDLEPDYVKTGADCVSFLMENEGKNRVKTFYCLPALTGTNFHPYELVVVPRTKATREYFSCSYDGIVHCEHGIGTLQLKVISSEGNQEV